MLIPFIIFYALITLVIFSLTFMEGYKWSFVTWLKFALMCLLWPVAAVVIIKDALISEWSFDYKEKEEEL